MGRTFPAIAPGSPRSDLKASRGRVQREGGEPLSGPQTQLEAGFKSNDDGFSADQNSILPKEETFPRHLKTQIVGRYRHDPTLARRAFRSNPGLELAQQGSMSTLYPVLPLRNAVAFPQISLPLVIGRPRSLGALDHAQRETRGLLLVVGQRVLTAGDPEPADLHRVGTLCRIDSLQNPEGEAAGGTRQLVVTGVARFSVEKYRAARSDSHCLLAEGGIPEELPVEDPIRAQALLLTLRALASDVLRLQSDPQEALSALVERIDDSGYLADLSAAYLSLPLPVRQTVLESFSIADRIEFLLDALQKEREVLQVQSEIREKMNERIGRVQRDALLREQIRTIRAELGEESGEEPGDDLGTRLKTARLPDEVAKVAHEELKRLRSLPSSSAEHHVLKSYLEWLSQMPWSRSTPDHLDLPRAQELLNQAHAGLDGVKKRILQHLAVARLRQDLRGPILCFLGPPGTGKTSLGKSIAEVMGRRFVRAALGGIRDEAEIRGHRRTYVGAMPGRIIQGIRRAGTRNPVMLLDEVDKLRQDFHGDPAAALLEVLDPEQNTQFTDHYLDVPFDLSEVFFIATANSLDPLPPALRDRLEVIEIPSYTIEEKIRIALGHLVPQSLEAHGIPESAIRWDRETLLDLIQYHTREAGVRELSRKISAVHREAAERLVTEPLPAGVSALPLRSSDLARQALGPGRTRFDAPSLQEGTVGLSLALAWTPLGGEILPVETRIFPGRGGLVLTGNLGEVMRESARLALSLIRALAVFDSLEPQRSEIHIHIPGGAIPKDGPSAGLALFLSILSAIQDEPLPSGLAMTGEITLSGKLLPVGGIREKVLAAHRGGLERILLPRQNREDLREIPPEVLGSLEIEFLDSVEEALIKLSKAQGESEPAPAPGGASLGSLPAALAAEMKSRLET
jgi:ATP-dependent Lon protease